MGKHFVNDIKLYKINTRFWIYKYRKKQYFRFMKFEPVISDILK